MRERAIYALAVMPSPGKEVRRKAFNRKARIMKTNFVYFILVFCVLGFFFVCFSFFVLFFVKSKVLCTVRGKSTQPSPGFYQNAKL